MSITKLKATRDDVVNHNIGLSLPVVQRLIAAIDEHIEEDNAADDNHVDSAAAGSTVDKAAQLRAQVAELEAEVASLKAAKVDPITVHEPTPVILHESTPALEPVEVAPTTQIEATPTVNVPLHTEAVHEEKEKHRNIFEEVGHGVSVPAEAVGHGIHKIL